MRLGCYKSIGKVWGDVAVKYRKKPVVIEAEQWFPGVHIRGVCLGECGCLVGAPPMQPHVHTLEGALVVSPGDYIITGIKGERYPCKPDVFEATYEPVKEGEEG